MYDYIRELATGLTDDELIDIFEQVLIMQDTPLCEGWEELIASCGVEGFLNLCKLMGGKTFTLPTLYHVLMVLAAMMVNQKLGEFSLEEAKLQVIGRLQLDGFDELVNKIHNTTECNPTVYQRKRARDLRGKNT